MRRKTLRWGTAAVVVAGMVTAAAGAAPATATARAVVGSGAAAGRPVPWDPTRADFNGDGKPDLAIGAPGCDRGAGLLPGAGCIAVVYGGSKGIDPAKHLILAESAAHVPGSAEAGDAFGSSLVTGDFDGDGYTDLAIGSPGEHVDLAAGGQGMITIMWGGPQGLTSGSYGYFGINTDSFDLGRFVAAGDFDGDGRTDLVFEGPDASLRVLSHITRDGAPTEPGQPVWQESLVPVDGLDGAPTRIENVAVGDTNGDGVSDLVAVVRDDSGNPDTYKAVLLTGGAHGLTENRVLRDASGNHLSGESAAIGDLNGDGYGDVVVGHGIDDLPSDAHLPTKGGALGVEYGGPDGVSATIAPQWINQSTPGVYGAAEAKDHMGASVAVGDVNGDGYADVVTGVPGEDFAGLTNAGEFLVLKGGPHGLTGTGSQAFTQRSSGIPGAAESNDAFGATVSVLGAMGAQRAQIVVGDPAENKAGAVWALPTSTAGAKAAGSIAFGPSQVHLIFLPLKSSFGDVLSGGQPVVPQS